MKPTLILTIGYPRSGKSTWAKTQDCPRVEPDAIRLAIHGTLWNAELEPKVWETAKIMVKALFNAGHDKVILDSTAITEARRAEWNDEAWNVEYKVFNTSAQTCKERAIQCGREYLVPVIEKMEGILELPTSLGSTQTQHTSHELK